MNSNLTLIFCGSLGQGFKPSIVGRENQGQSRISGWQWRLRLISESTWRAPHEFESDPDFLRIVGARLQTFHCWERKSGSESNFGVAVEIALDIGVDVACSA